jgi:FkbM family methyltransferase
VKSFIKKLPFGLGDIITALSKSLFGYQQVYYSQNGEDIILKSLFKNKQHGFYVDVGAHHPERYSNTYLLYKKGWHGINIDANPDAINKFNSARPNDMNIEAGIGEGNNTLTYHMFKDSAVNTFSEVEANKWKASSWNKYLGSKTIKLTSVNEILEKNLPMDISIDLLTIDVEGLDLSVLQDLEWTKYHPDVVIVEDINFDFEKMTDSKTYDILQSNGYKLYSVVKFSLIFIRK